MSDTTKDINSGERTGFGNKTLNYLKEKSRTAVEKNTNTTALYFELDFEKSKKNFYGEILIKHWTNPKGVAVNGIISIKEADEVTLEDIPNQLATLDFVVYIDHLKELNIWPQLGDFFSIKNRIYIIHRKSLLDSDKNSILTDQEAVTIKFYCMESDQENMNPQGVNVSETQNNSYNEKQF